MMELGWQKLELGKRETNMWYLKTQAPVTLVTCLLSVIARICFETRRSDWSVPIPIACSSGTHLTWQTTPPLWAEDDALYQSSGWIGMEGPRSADFWPPSRGPEVSQGPYRSRGPNAPVAGSMKSHQRLGWKKMPMESMEDPCCGDGVQWSCWASAFEEGHIRGKVSIRFL